MKKNGLKMLAEADKVLSSMGLKPFLTYGALLGAYRGHGFISYYPDIDLGILAEDAPKDMRERMKRKSGKKPMLPTVSHATEAISYMTPIKNWNAKDYKTRIVHTNDRTYRKFD